MAKANRKNKITYNQIEFDSNEELEFYHWCEEALKYNIISSFNYNHISYDLSPKQTMTITKQLKTKTKEIEKHLFHPHVFSPDFWIIKGERWDLLKDSHKLISTHDDQTEFVIDTKGSFQMHDGSRSFSINQKWTYAIHGVYVNKVVPEKFFKLTWLPEDARLTAKTKQVQKKYKTTKTLYEKFALGQ
jgi:hypothetical protein